MNEYAKKLKDPRWQKVRLFVFKRDNWECQICLDDENTLHCHHLYYLPETDPWDYPLETFKTLCECCHEAESSAMLEVISNLTMAIKTKGILSCDLFPLVNGFENMPMLKDANLQMQAMSTMICDKFLIKRWMKKELKSMMPKITDKNISVAVDGKPTTG